MQDKTPIYMMIIVGMVAVVGIFVIITAPATTSVDTGITGNAVFDTGVSSFSVFGKVFFTLFLVGVAGYMYFKLE